MDDLPCYAERFSIPSFNYEKKGMRYWINEKLQEVAHNGPYKNTGIAVFSVTEKDNQWMEWLKEMYKYKNATCCSTLTKFHAGKYRCFFVCIPVADNV